MRQRLRLLFALSVSACALVPSGARAEPGDAEAFAAMHRCFNHVSCLNHVSRNMANLGRLDSADGYRAALDGGFFGSHRAGHGGGGVGRLACHLEQWPSNELLLRPERGGRCLPLSPLGRGDRDRNADENVRLRGQAGGRGVGSGHCRPWFLGNLKIQPERVLGREVSDSRPVGEVPLHDRADICSWQSAMDNAPSYHLNGRTVPDSSSTSGPLSR